MDNRKQDNIADILQNINSRYGKCIGHFAKGKSIDKNLKTSFLY